jgi:hypothetical protein
LTLNFIIRIKKGLWHHPQPLKAKEPWDSGVPRFFLKFFLLPAYVEKNPLAHPLYSEIHHQRQKNPVVSDRFIFRVSVFSTNACPFSY